MNMNIFQIAASREFAWRQMMADYGYESFTTFFSDFTIAELCGGISGVKDTFRNAFNSWKTDYKYLTELVMVLNHKIWEHNSRGNDDMARLYDELWQSADMWCCENLTKEAAQYYYRVTD